MIEYSFSSSFFCVLLLVLYYEEHFNCIALYGNSVVRMEKQYNIWIVLVAVVLCAILLLKGMAVNG